MNESETVRNVDKVSEFICPYHLNQNIESYGKTCLVEWSGVEEESCNVIDQVVKRRSVGFFLLMNEIE